MSLYIIDELCDPSKIIAPEGKKSGETISKGNNRMITAGRP